MPELRHTAVAGTFYPADPAQLRNDVAGFLAAGASRLAATAFSPDPRPTAIIAPHAGYPYSGPIAGTAFATLVARPEPAVNRVILIGPSHRVSFEGIAGTTATAFATPLGPVPVDQDALATLRQLPWVHDHDAAHRHEHALEVELPFLLAVAAPDFRIIPLLTGNASTGQIAEVFELLTTGPETLIVVSSDLSHFLPYDVATGVDAETADIIVDLAPDRLSSDRACGQQAIRGLLEFARRKTLTATTLDLRNSGDTAGSRDQVVGYTAIAFQA